MNEIKRIFSNRRLITGIILIVILNAFMFRRQQEANNYGLDFGLPSCSVSVGFTSDFQTAQPKPNAEKAEKAYKAYTEKLNSLKKLPISEAEKESKQEKRRLSVILEAAELLSSNTSIFGSEQLARYREQQPELIEKLEKNEINLDEIRLEYIAVNNVCRQLSYLTGYDGFLASIRKNKADMLQFSVFNTPDSFTERNIIKTASEFEKLQGVPLSLVTDGTVASFLGFPLTDYLFLTVLALICIAFSDERKKGLWNVIHAAPNGRMRLAMHRVGILFLTSVVGVLLLYGANLVAGFSVYGGTADLKQAAQSVEILHKLPLVCSIGSFLLQYLVFRCLAGFLIALLLFLMLTAVNNVKYSLLISAAVLAAEYGFYRFIPVQSAFNVLKYFNIFTYISLSDLYTNYLNISVFGYPVGIRSVLLSALLPLILLTGAACIFIHCKKKPAAGKDFLGKAACRLNGFTDKFIRRLHLPGRELHKILFIQKGFLILLLFIYIVCGLNFTVKIPINNPADAAARQYTELLSGEITESTVKRLNEIQTELDEKLAAFEEAKSRYEAGETGFAEFDAFAREAEEASIKSDGLAAVRERITRLNEIGKRGGFTPWLIEESPVNGTYGAESNLNQRNAAVVSILTVIFLFAGAFAYETQSGMNGLLASLKRGRGILLLNKIGAAAILTAFVWGFVFRAELNAFLKICDKSSFAAAVQNITMLENFPVHCSIGVFLAGLYLIRYAALFTCALLTMLISAYMKKTETAYIASVGILLVPSLLYHYIGLEQMKYLSLAPAAEVMPLILYEPPLKSTCIILTAFIITPIAAILLLHRKMRVKS